MKRSFTASIAILSFLFLTTSVSAQQFSIKTGLAWTNASTVLDETIGIMYGFTFTDAKIELAGDFNYYFDEPGDDKHSPYAFNLDVHYTIWEIPRYKVYPIIGFNIANYYNIQRAGLNFGMGTELKFNDAISIFSEGKLVHSDWEGVTLNLGVRLNPIRALKP